MTATAAGESRRRPIADLEDKPGHLIRRAHQLQAAIFEAAAGRFGVTAAQHVIMTALFKHPGVDQATLAAMVALDKVTTGHILRRLGSRGLVERADSPADGRAWRLTLTGKGTQLLRRMQPAIRASQSRLLSPLTDDQRRQFFALMRRIVGMAPPPRNKTRRKSR